MPQRLLLLFVILGWAVLEDGYAPCPAYAWPTPILTKFAYGRYLAQRLVDSASTVENNNAIFHFSGS